MDCLPTLMIESEWSDNALKMSDGLKKYLHVKKQVSKHLEAALFLRIL